jgi:hypothetical protein
MALIAARSVGNGPPPAKPPRIGGDVEDCRHGESVG